MVPAIGCIATIPDCLFIDRLPPTVALAPKPLLLKDLGPLPVTGAMWTAGLAPNPLLLKDLGLVK